MANIPFIVPLNFPLTSGLTLTRQFQNSPQQEFEIFSIIQESEGAFDIIDWSNNGSLNYSPANESNPLSGNVFPDAGSQNSAPRELPEPYKIQSNSIMTFTIKDTSSAGNEVTIFLIGILRDI